MKNIVKYVREKSPEKLETWVNSWHVLSFLTKYSVHQISSLPKLTLHTTATWDKFWNIIKLVRNHSDGVSLVSPWLIEYRSYKKIKSWTSHIVHHTSHIAYYIGICKFYKILVINTVVTFKNSSKLILKTFDKYFWMEIITLTIQTPMAGRVLSDSEIRSFAPNSE